ncbi:unnamed protein product [Blepharisma stoltei]|uniref:Uncharacterized protein n=1 Tax=Blepharisma stoltei TaxID=1481888 RepID=A0AAU9IQQ9_9CILI|nr:unnamed protein product [Blepharisma stoltei]
MTDLICVQSACGKPAEFECNCLVIKTFWCNSHLVTHLCSSSIGHTLKMITKNPNISTETTSDHPNEHDLSYPFDCPNMNPHIPSNLNSCKPLFETYFKRPSEPLVVDYTEYIDQFYKYPFKEDHKEPNPTVELTLDLIYEHISAIINIKNKFPKIYLESSYCSIVLKDSLKSIEQYYEILDEVKDDVESAVWNSDSPFSLIDIINIAEHIQIEIEFLEKVNEILLLENHVKSYWLANILEIPEKIDKLKSEFIGKAENIKQWCYQYKNKKQSSKSIDDKKINSVIDILNLIFELINHRFEFKYLFQIKSNKLLTYGIEARKWVNIPLPFDQYNIYSSKAYVAELPNYEIFCLEKNKYPFIFDLKTWKISKIFPKFCECILSLPMYYENCVYVFSLRERPCLEKFDLINNKKTTLPSPFINYLYTISCCLYKKSILICSEKSMKLCKFDLLIESYSEIQFIDLYPVSKKMLFTGNSRCYIADSKNGIFESEIHNEYTWNKIGSFQIDFIRNCTNRSHLNLVSFFMMEYEDIITCQFDLCHKNIYTSESPYDYFSKLNQNKNN